MKPTILLRLYPRAWRGRYGSEMLAMLGERELTTREGVDLIRLAVAEWRRVTGFDAFVLPAFVSAVGVVIGRALAARESAPDAIHSLDMIFALTWTTLIFGRLMWFADARFRRHQTTTVFPRLSTNQWRVVLGIAAVVGATHFWVWPTPQFRWPLVIFSNPAYLMATFAGLTRVAIMTKRTLAAPSQHPLGLD